MIKQSKLFWIKFTTWQLQQSKSPVHMNYGLANPLVLAAPFFWFCSRQNTLITIANTVNITSITNIINNTLIITFTTLPSQSLPPSLPLLCVYRYLKQCHLFKSFSPLCIKITHSYLCYICNNINHG